MKLRNQAKWLCIMTVLSCLLIGAMEMSNGIKRFWQEKKEDRDILISVESVEENRPTGKDDYKEKQEECDSQNEVHKQPAGEFDAQSLSLGIRGILRGSFEMVMRALKQVRQPETEQRAVCESQPEPVEKEPGPPVMWLVSDLHYMSSSATDYGEAFQQFQAKSDGKVIRYLPQILDSIIDEASDDRPDILVLTGDLTMNGEKINHEALADKLAGLQAVGVQVLVIPGNHDINNRDASVYFGEKAQETEAVTPEEFGRIYADFGWNQAVSRDEASFSYVYALRDGLWLMLLDTAQYDPQNLVEGMVRPETLLWMDENLSAAREQGIEVVVLGHHNLLSESTMFTAMCVLENGTSVTELLESYHIPLYISGHLHLQRAKKHKREPSDEGYGICEIVSDAVSIPPCQYGIVKWQDNGDIHFYTRQADVGAWAVKNGAEDENLLNFSEYKETYIRQIIEDQIKSKTKQVREKTSGEMAKIYADVYADYCAGLKIDQREAMRSWEYRQWEQYWPDSKQADELRAMIRDSFKDNNYFILEKSTDRLREEK